jgi:xanthine dehydrogenase YagS FAD-binding subunit
LNPFSYERPDSVAAAVLAGSRRRGVRYVAGGTNLLDLMKIAVEEPTVLVDINRLPMDAVEDRSDGLHIGALARMSDVAANHDVRRRFPMVALALEASASPQLRNMASMGGNLLQRTRCAYFRDVATPCNKRTPGSGCGALAGDNRTNAVLGVSERCIATHASDVAVALVALEATVHVSGRAGDRVIPLSALYRTPSNTPHVETVLAPGDLITGITIAHLPFAAHSTYLKVRDRAQYAFALASVAVALDVSRGVVHQARIALGGVATVPWRATAAERILTGAPASRTTFARAADAAMAGAHVASMNAYKVPLAKRTVIRALETLVA